MKKKKIIVLVVAIISIGIFLIINNFIQHQNNQIQKLSEIYDRLSTSQTYLFEMIKNDENKTIMAKKDNKTVIDKYSEDNHETTLVKGDNTYFVLHDREEYYVYKQNNVEQNFLTDGLKEIKDKTFTEGTEKVLGKKYTYEEYSGSTIFTVTNILDINDEDIKTRFYFDKDNNLSYIKTIAGTKQELLKVNLESNVNDSIFEIPSHYAEN